MNSPLHSLSREELLALLEEAELRYKTTLDIMREGVQIIGFDWQYLYVNNSVVTQSKFSREELIGRTMMEKYPGIEQTEMFRALAQTMQDREIRRFENKFTFPDGSEGYFELSIQPVPQGVLILSTDITERKKAEQEKTEHIRGLEKMMFLTSHRVRKPIAASLGIMNLLEGKRELDRSELNTVVEQLKSNTQDLDSLTRELTLFIHEMGEKSKMRNWS